MKGYKTAEAFDQALYEAAEQEWDQREDLIEYVPDEKIPEGHMTSERNPIFDHGYGKWVDMFNTRQLFSISMLLSRFDEFNDQNIREMFLLALSNSLPTQNMMTGYDYSYNKIQHLFKSNSFDPPQSPCEGNVWGAEYGRGTFRSIWDMITDGIEYQSITSAAA